VTLETPIRQRTNAAAAAATFTDATDATDAERPRITGMACRSCGHAQPLAIAYVCPACFGPLG